MPVTNPLREAAKAHQHAKLRVMALESVNVAAMSVEDRCELAADYAEAAAEEQRLRRILEQETQVYVESKA